MFVARVTLASMDNSDFMYGKHVPEPREEGETWEAYEERTWQGKVHVDEKGKLLMNKFALKNCLEASAQWPRLGPKR